MPPGFKPRNIAPHRANPAWRRFYCSVSSPSPRPLAICEAHSSHLPPKSSRDNPPPITPALSPDSHPDQRQSRPPVGRRNPKLRLKLGAWAKASAATRIKGAARRRIQRARQFAGQLDALAPIVRVQSRRRRQQRLSIRMTRVIKDLILVPFYAAAKIHHHDFISDVLDDRQVVG